MLADMPKIRSLRLEEAVSGLLFSSILPIAQFTVREARSSGKSEIFAAAKNASEAARSHTFDHFPPAIRPHRK